MKSTNLIVVALIVIATVILIYFGVQILKPSVESTAEKAALGTYLSDLKPLSSVGSYLKDINPEKHLIFVQGSKYEKGLCVSSNSGLLVFSVLVDGKEVYESRPMGVADSEEVNVTIKDVNHLTLTAKDNGISSSYVVWADARVFNR